MISVGFLTLTRCLFQINSGEIQEAADDLYGSISDAASPNEAMYTALSDGEIQVTSLIIEIWWRSLICVVLCLP